MLPTKFKDRWKDWDIGPSEPPLKGDDDLNPSHYTKKQLRRFYKEWGKIVELIDKNMKAAKKVIRE